MSAGLTEADVQRWAEAESLRKAPNRLWSDDPAGSVTAALAVLDSPETILLLSPKRREQLAWNLPWMFTEIPSNRGFADSQRVAFVRKSPAFLTKVFETLDDYSSALDMWWEIILSGVKAHESATLGAIHESLTAQLGSGNVRCDASALHGFNHLRDPRCRSPINAWLKRCEDDDMRAYARRAMRFELL